MSLNCRPGDLAICVIADNPENIGSIVHVIREHQNVPGWNYGKRAAWWCRSLRPMTWVFRSTGERHVGCEGPIPDDVLRPIRPDAARRSSEQPVALMA